MSFIHTGALRILLLVLCGIVAPYGAAAQKDPVYDLAGSFSKGWHSTLVQEDGQKVDVDLSVTYNSDGTFTSGERDMLIQGKWSFSADGLHLLIFEQRSGNWRGKDTLVMDLQELTPERHVVRYTKEFGVITVTYEPDEALTPVAAVPFEPFWHLFREAVKGKDPKKVADMTHFPFFSYDLAGLAGNRRQGPEFNRKDFLRYYSRLFDKTAKMLIATSTPTPMTDDDGNITRYAVGIRRSGSTVIWLEFHLGEDGRWLLAGTGNVSSGDEEEE